MEMNVCRIINAHIQSGRIANPTERKMQDSANDYYSAGLYRAMFRNETDLNKLDYNYADHILGYAEFGCKNAIEDYRNYFLYVKNYILLSILSMQKCWKMPLSKTNRRMRHE